MKHLLLVVLALCAAGALARSRYHLPTEVKHPDGERNEAYTRHKLDRFQKHTAEEGHKEHTAEEGHKEHTAEEGHKEHTAEEGHKDREIPNQKTRKNYPNREDESFRIYKEDQQDKAYHPSFKTVPKHAKNTGIDWMQRGQDELNKALASWPTWSKATNVIYFIGDGMGISTLTAARIFNAQQRGQSDTEGKLSWEDFPYTGLIKTYNTNQQTPDSAGTATAFACGVKTRAGSIGVNENVTDCPTLAGNEARSIIHHAIDDNKWTGIISTARVTHATPAAAYAHSPNRNWESDNDVPLEDRDTCWDIARQLVDADQNKNIKVMLGGGRREFQDSSVADNEYPTQFGTRSDGRDLIQEWLTDRQARGTAAYVEDKASFDAVDVSSAEYLLGLFEPSHMKYESERMEETGDVWTEPSLAQMTKKSLDILKKGPNGYVLYVEGGRVDHAHHGNNAHRALRDTLALQEAVQVAADETSAADTLIIVTADHSHAFIMAGYPKLDNEILGTVVSTSDNLVIAYDGKPYLTLGYLNGGDGFRDHRTPDGNVANEQPRKDMTGETTTDKDYLQDASYPLYSETHGGEDVAVYARGPMSHLFSGQHEQHYIAHAAMYATCIGWNKDFCESNPTPPPCP